MKNRSKRCGKPSIDVVKYNEAIPVEIELLPEHIIAACADYYKLNPALLPTRSRCRENGLVYCRHMAVYLLHHILKLPDGVIGEILKRERTTILHSRELIKRELPIYEDVRKAQDTIKSKLHSYVTGSAA